MPEDFPAHVEPELTELPYIWNIRPHKTQIGVKLESNFKTFAAVLPFNRVTTHGKELPPWFQFRLYV